MKLSEKIKYILLPFNKPVKFCVDTIAQYYNEFKRQHPFAFKIVLSLGFAVLVYSVYIAALLNFLFVIVILSKYKTLFALLEVISMLSILGFPLAAAVYMIKQFYPVLEYEKYFRWLSDCIAVLVPIVFLYDTYYHLDDITKMFLLNKWFLGFPYVILLIRAVIGFYKLKQEASMMAFDDVLRSLITEAESNTVDFDEWKRKCKKIIESRFGIPSKEHRAFRKISSLDEGALLLKSLQGVFTQNNSPVQITVNQSQTATSVAQNQLSLQINLNIDNAVDLTNEQKQAARELYKEVETEVKKDRPNWEKVKDLLKDSLNYGLKIAPDIIRMAEAYYKAKL